MTYTADSCTEIGPGWRSRGNLVKMTHIPPINKTSPSMDASTLEKKAATLFAPWVGTHRPPYLDLFLSPGKTSDVCFQIWSWHGQYQSCSELLLFSVTNYTFSASFRLRYYCIIQCLLCEEIQMFCVNILWFAAPASLCRCRKLAALKCFRLSWWKEICFHIVIPN